jgi:hypothetical protein
MLDDFPNMERWFDIYAMMAETRKNRKPMDDKTRAIYFDQTAATVRVHR